MVAVAALISVPYRSYGTGYLPGVAAAIVATNAKFTGLVYLCFALAAGLIWCALRNRQWLWKYIGIHRSISIPAVIVWGFNPYVTNTYYRSQPLSNARFRSVPQPRAIE